MNKEFYIDGYELTLLNSKNLLELCKISASKNNFGIANSLSILSAEESIKSIIILSHCSTPNNEAEEFRKIFRDHKTKHEYIKLYFWIIDFFVKMTNKRHEKFIKSFKKNSIESVQEYEKNMNESIKWSINQKDKLLDLNILLDWWDKANLKKNQGLYINLKDNNWVNPQDFDKTDFEQSLKYSTSLYDYAVFSKNIFTDPGLLKFMKKIDLKKIKTNG